MALNTRKKKKTFVALGVTLAALLLAGSVFILLEGEPSGPGSTRAPGAASPANADVHTLLPGGFATSTASWKEELEHYQAWAKYPPFSRPLREDMRDLLQPYRAVTPPTGVLKDGKPTDITCGLTLKALVTVGEDEQTVAIECFRKHDEKRIRLPLQIERIGISELKTGRRMLPPVYIGDTGEHGDTRGKDLVYTALIRPRKVDWGQMLIGIKLRVEGIQHSLTTTWFSTPHTVAEFRPVISESREEGHLVVQAPVLVAKAGHFEFHANLQQYGGERRMVARSTWSGHLERGSHVVRFTFWGKVLRDSGVDGPYTVRNIRGRRINLPIAPGAIPKEIPKSIDHSQPEFEYMRDAADYTTREYAAAEFSDREWVSDQKDNRIAFLKRMIRDSSDNR